MDNVSKRKRSNIMKTVRAKDTKLEKRFRKALRALKQKFTTNDKHLIGKPDIVFSKQKIVIFIDSCFWHGCRFHCRKPKSNKSYWNKKILLNKKRDKIVSAKLKKDGWLVIRFWEHSLRSNIDACIKKVDKGISRTHDDIRKVCRSGQCI